MFTLGIPSLSLTSMASRAGVPAVIVLGGVKSITISRMPVISSISASTDSEEIIVQMPTISSLEAA
jgi:hypothetical protein